MFYSTRRLFRSSDHGWTGSADSGLSRAADSNPYRLRLREDGRLERYYLVWNGPFKVQRSLSSDNGKTWSLEEDLFEVKFPEELGFKQLIPSQMLETQSRSLLWFMWSRPLPEVQVIGGQRYEREVPRARPYVIRSTDQGDTWSGPNDVDHPWPGNHLNFAKDAINEIYAAQTKKGPILALIRPSLSPLMWESWSEDDGQSWTPAARGPFPMCACEASMICTTSGVILIGGRFPGIAVQVSRDDGMSWKGYRIDAVGWANGAMF